MRIFTKEVGQVFNASLVTLTSPKLHLKFNFLPAILLDLAYVRRLWHISEKELSCLRDFHFDIPAYFQFLRVSRGCRCLLIRSTSISLRRLLWRLLHGRAVQGCNGVEVLNKFSPFASGNGRNNKAATRILPAPQGRERGHRGIINFGLRDSSIKHNSGKWRHMWQCACNRPRDMDTDASRTLAHLLIPSAAAAASAEIKAPQTDLVNKFL